MMTDALKDLLARLERTLADPDTRLTWLHWSDAETLRQAVSELERHRRLEDQLYRVITGNG